MKQKPPLNADAMQYASGYSLDLYCDHFSGFGDEWHEWAEFPHQYVGETFAECARKARKAGWKFHHKTRTATCPKCSG